MQITRNAAKTMAGPSEWFTGTVYIDTIAVPANGSRLSASIVHFAPGARTAWHTHPNGQTIYVTEGIGRCQRRGGPVEIIRPGDRVFFEPGEEHWHGAAPARFMTHIAMLEVDDQGTSAMWGTHVNDEEYGQDRMTLQLTIALWRGVGSAPLSASRQCHHGVAASGDREMPINTPILLRESPG